MLGSPLASLSQGAKGINLSDMYESLNPLLISRSLVDFPNPANEAFGWHFQFLTIIGLALATLTFCLGITADVTGSRRVFFLKNILLFCSAPLEVLISILYWGLRSVRGLQTL